MLWGQIVVGALKDIATLVSAQYLDVSNVDIFIHKDYLGVDTSPTQHMDKLLEHMPLLRTRINIHTLLPTQVGV